MKYNAAGRAQSAKNSIGMKRKTAASAPHGGGLAHTGMKLLGMVLAGLLLMVQYALWFGDKNLFDWYRLTQATAAIHQGSAALQHGNDKLLAEVVDLKEGGETVETTARSKFGLIKPGETFYQVVE